MKKSSLVAVSFFLFSHCIPAMTWNDTTLNLGNLTQFVGKVQTDEKGSTEKFDFNPYLGAGMRIEINESWGIYPNLFLTLPRSGVDKEISEMSYGFSGAIGYSIRDWVLSTGLGLFFSRVSGKGGEQVLQNGGANTLESFPMPNGSATTTNLNYHLNVEYYFHPDWSAHVGLQIFNTEDSEERAFNYTLGATYHLGDLFEK